MSTVQTFNSINPALDYFHDNASTVSKAWKESLHYGINRTALPVFIWSFVTGAASMALAFTATVLVYNRARLLFSIPIILATGITIIITINLIQTKKSLSAAKKIFEEGISVDDVKMKIKELKASHTTVFLNFFNVLNHPLGPDLNILLYQMPMPAFNFTRIYANPLWEKLWNQMILTSDIFNGLWDGDEAESLVALRKCLNEIRPVQALEIKNIEPNALYKAFLETVKDAEAILQTATPV